MIIIHDRDMNISTGWVVYDRDSPARFDGHLPTMHGPPVKQRYLQ
jgi:hypothetical protein